MPGADFSNHTDQQLIEHADAGLQGQGAIIEALWRHRKELLRQQESANALNDRMSRLAVVGVVLAAVGVLLAAVQVWAALR